MPAPIKTLIFLGHFFLLWGQALGQEAGSGYALKLMNGHSANLNSSFAGLSLPITVSAWIKPIDPAANQRIFFSHTSVTNYYGVSFQILNGQLNIAFGNGGTTRAASRWTGSSNIKLQPNRWYHVAGVIYQDGTIELYLDGIALQVLYSGYASPPMGIDNSNGVIGRANNNTASYSNAEFDELSFWEKPLSVAEIRSLMCRKLTGNETGLLAYYRYDDANGNNLSNEVSGGPDGILVNAPQWVISGAAIGNRSDHSYGNSITSYTYTLRSGLQVEVANINPPVKGVQVYEVTEAPNSSQGLPAPVNYYFGVFLCAEDKSTPISYDLKVKGGGTAYKVFGRFSNATAAWSQKTGALSGADYVVSGEADRQEYVIDDGCPELKVDAGADIYVCSTAGLSVELSVTHNRPGYAYQWSNGATGGKISVSVSDTGTYIVQADSSGCKGIDTVRVIIPSGVIKIDLKDTVFCKQSSRELRLNVPGYQFGWPDGSTGNSFVVNSSGMLVIEAFGPCDTISHQVVVLIEDCNCPLYIPNVFTPNNDGLNETFDIKTSCTLRHYELVIYNRWGSEIFISHSADHDWDGRVNGKDAPQGVYYFVVRYSGATYSDEQTGFLTLIR